jgi:hypothetical protein
MAWEHRAVKMKPLQLAKEASSSSSLLGWLKPSGSTTEARAPYAILLLKATQKISLGET